MLPNMSSTSSTTGTDSFSSEIDRLLWHYLQLLDRYTDLHHGLDDAHKSFNQNLARAKFNSTRHYGQEDYDGRTQATRLCSVTIRSDSNELVGGIAPDGLPAKEWNAKSKVPPLFKVQPADFVEATEAESLVESTASPEDYEGQKVEDGNEKTHNKEKTESTKKPQGKDPIRMFEALPGSSLRLAQKDMVHSVQDIVPKIASIQAEMQEFEIRIRRARKRKAAAESKGAASVTK